MRAVYKYDAGKNLKFSTHATWWIRQAIGKAILHKGNSLGISGYAIERLPQIHNIETELLVSSGKKPSAAEIKKRLTKTYKSTSEEIIESLRGLSTSGISLETPLNTTSDDEITLRDIIEDNSPGTEETAIDYSSHEALRTILMQAVSSLTKREQQVLYERFAGIPSGKEALKGRSQIGAKMGNISDTRIGQYENSGLVKILRALAPDGPAMDLIENFFPDATNTADTILELIKTVENKLGSLSDSKYSTWGPQTFLKKLGRQPRD